MTEPSDTERLLVIARSRRSAAINDRDRSLLNVQIAEHNAITAERKVENCDAEVDRLLDRLLSERAAKAVAEKLVTS